MPKTLFQKHFFYTDDVIFDGLRHGLLQYRTEHGWNEQ